MMDVSVVIANWNGRDLLPDCLKAIDKALNVSRMEGEVIVIDNGSKDGSVEYLRSEWPDVVVVGNDTNRGFAEANNQGFSIAKAPIVATVNNDVRLDESWFLACDLLQAPRVASVATRILYASDLLINSTGISIDRLGIAHDRDDGLSSATAGRDVFGACAGAALYRSEAIAQAGGFDESHFAYYEDVDLAWRLRRLGWLADYSDVAISHHLYSATSKRVPGLKSRLIVRNHLLTLVKNASAAQLLRGLPLLVVYVVSLIVGRIVFERDVYALRGLLEAIVAIPRTRREGHGAGARLDISRFERSEPLPTKFRRAIRKRLAVSGRDAW